jgi:hypothetical protein
MSFDDDVDVAIPRPAAPSPTQSHGTVMVALLSGFVVVAVLLWLSVRDVGPFTGRVLTTEYTGDKARVTIQVTNEGKKAGHAKCRIARVTENGDRQTDFAFLTDRVAPHATITQTVELPVQPGVKASQVDC